MFDLPDYFQKELENSINNAVNAVIEILQSIIVFINELYEGEEVKK